jgi:hypothetical protein
MRCVAGALGGALGGARRGGGSVRVGAWAASAAKGAHAPPVAAPPALLLPRAGGARGLRVKFGINKGGVDYKEMFGEEPMNERTPKGVTVIEATVEEVKDAMAKGRAIQEKHTVAFIKNWKPIDISEDDPAAHVDIAKFLNATALDYKGVDERLKGIALAWTHCHYPPFFGEDNGREIRERPQVTCSVKLKVDQFGWDEHQMEFFKHLVSRRYSPAKRELTIVSRDQETVHKNFEHAQKVLATLLDEVAKRKGVPLKIASRGERLEAQTR